MDPIAQQYIDTITKADTAKDDAYNEAQTTRDAALTEKGLASNQRNHTTEQAETYNTIWTAYYSQTDSAYAAHNTAYTDAWDLLATSTEPQVAFIGKNVRSYVAEVMMILPLLPTDITTLRALGREHGWCSDFRDLLTDAISAGVLVNDYSGARGELEDYLNEEITSRARDRILRMVDAVVAEAVKAVEPQASASA
jgi:hypothetical protein